MPVLGVVTKARSDQGFSAEVQRLLPEAVNVVRVRALRECFDDNAAILPPMGLNDLVDATAEIIPEAAQKAFAAAQKASIDLKKKAAHKVVVVAAASAAAAGAAPIPFAALTEAEGLAMRPGPRPRLDEGLLALLRDAISASRVVTFEYPARPSGGRTPRRVEPYGLLYGNRAFLIGRSACGTEYQLWRLANISAAAVTGEPFTRDEAFDLQRFARRSFGTFQEQPVAVVLRFAAAVAEDVAEFVFHPDQAVERNADGSMTVRFTAGGIKEICWHLVTWGTAVTVEQPACLRQRLAEMCATLAAHHGAAP